MLEPQTRELLFDVLQPPEDHTLDFAIGTTFTLDLLALLIAPVAFTLFEADVPPSYCIATHLRYSKACVGIPIGWRSFATAVTLPFQTRSFHNLSISRKWSSNASPT